MSEVIHGFKSPMFAPRENPLKYKPFFEKLQYPLLTSPKIDGIRGLSKNAERLDYDHAFNEISLGYSNMMFSRTLTLLPSRQVQELYSCCADLEGELVEGDETDSDLCNRTQSFVMSEDKPSDRLHFRIFDCTDINICNEDFEFRLEHARTLISEYTEMFPHLENRISLIEHTWCDDLDSLLAEEERVLALGYEGLMMRSPFGRYKQGRGTFLEGLIYKLKRFQDCDGILVGIEEGDHNTNPDIRSNLGGAKRSFAREGLVKSGLAGVLLVEVNGEIARVAPGQLKHDERRRMMEYPEKYIGNWCTFRHFSHGAKNTFRQARFANWRNKIDIVK